MKLFAILKLKAIQKKKNKCKGRIKTVNFEKKDIDLHFLYIHVSVEKCLKMKESNISFLLLATRKCNLHIVQTIKWYKVKKKQQ